MRDHRGNLGVQNSYIKSPGPGLSAFHGGCPLDTLRLHLDMTRLWVCVDPQLSKLATRCQRCSSAGTTQELQAAHGSTWEVPCDSRHLVSQAVFQQAVKVPLYHGTAGCNFNTLKSHGRRFISGKVSACHRPRPPIGADPGQLAQNLRMSSPPTPTMGHNLHRRLHPLHRISRSSTYAKGHRHQGGSCHDEGLAANHAAAQSLPSEQPRAPPLCGCQTFSTTARSLMFWTCKRNQTY